MDLLFDTPCHVIRQATSLIIIIIIIITSFIVYSCISSY